MGWSDTGTPGVAKGGAGGRCATLLARAGSATRMSRLAPGEEGGWRESGRFRAAFPDWPDFRTAAPWRPVALLLPVVVAIMPGCLVTETKRFPQEQNLPSSVVTDESAEFQADEIIRLEGLPAPLDGGVPTELTLNVVVRDPNLDQPLQARLFADNAPPGLPSSQEVGCPPGVDNVLLCRDVEPTPDRQLERPLTLGPIQLALLGLGLDEGRCLRLDLRVSEQFNTDRGSDDPDGDFFVSQLVWWVLVTNGDPNVPLGSCPQ